MARGLVSLAALKRVAERLSGYGMRGALPLRKILAIREQVGVPQSVLETRMLRLIRLAKLPLPFCQYPVAAGEKTFFLDFAYPDLGIAIETDGFGSHASPTDLESDHIRANILSRLGWRLFRFTWAQVSERPGEVTETIRGGDRRRQNQDSSR